MTYDCPNMFIHLYTTDYEKMILIHFKSTEKNNLALNQSVS